MAEQALISVITPTYNRAAFLAEAIDSVLAQSFQNFELLIVDDGSTDDTQTVVNNYKHDARVVYQFQENQGQSVARNNALHHSRGEFICFLDSDDRWLPERLQWALDAFEAQPFVGVVYGDELVMNEAGQVTGSKSTGGDQSGRILPAMLKDNIIPLNTGMIRKECLEKVGGVDPTIRVADDYDMWLRLSAYYDFLHIPKVMAHYRVMNVQISSDVRRRLSTNAEILKQFEERHGDRASAAEMNGGWAYFYERGARAYAANGHWHEAYGSLAQLLRRVPFSLSAWRTALRVSLLRIQAMFDSSPDIK